MLDTSPPLDRIGNDMFHVGTTVLQYEFTVTPGYTAIYTLILYIVPDIL